VTYATALVFDRDDRQVHKRTSTMHNSADTASRVTPQHCSAETARAVVVLEHEHDMIIQHAAVVLLAAAHYDSITAHRAAAAVTKLLATAMLLYMSAVAKSLLHMLQLSIHTRLHKQRVIQLLTAQDWLLWHYDACLFLIMLRCCF
jgi:hypothetical protein